MGKRTTAMVLGITGGVFGILGGVIAMLIGGVGSAFEAEGASTVGWLGIAAVFIGVAGIVGGALARSRPTTSAGIQLFAAVTGVIAVSAAWALAGPLLAFGALFAFLGRHVTAAATPPAM